MNKKEIILLALIIVGALSVLTVSNADAWFWSSKKVDTDKLVGETKEVGETQKFEAEATEANHYKLLTAVPLPQLDTSQERKNLVKRLDRWNDENKISYIYLVNYGKVMAFYTVKGKVSSVNSRLTTGEQIVVSERCLRRVYAEGEGSCFQTVESPQLDGSYGTNGDAIFFFTTEDIYVEWRGDYMLSDQPLKLSTPPELIRVIK